MSQFIDHCGDSICEFGENMQNCQNDCQIDIQQNNVSQKSEENKIHSKRLNWIYFSIPLIVVVVFLTYFKVKRNRGRAEMINQKRQQNAYALRSYVIVNLRKGYTKEQIRNALIKNNYTDKEIEEAFKGIK